MQSDARPLQEQSKSQTAALKQELAALRERVAAQYELLEQRADQISDIKKDRDHWRQQAANLVTNLSLTVSSEAKNKILRWWPFWFFSADL